MFPTSISKVAYFYFPAREKKNGNVPRLNFKSCLLLLSSWLASSSALVDPLFSASSSACSRALCCWWSIRMNNCRCFGGRCMALSMSSLLSGGLFAEPSSSPSVLTAPAEEKNRQQYLEYNLLQASFDRHYYVVKLLMCVKHQLFICWCPVQLRHVVEHTEECTHSHTVQWQDLLIRGPTHTYSDTYIPTDSALTTMDMQRAAWPQLHHQNHAESDLLTDTNSNWHRHSTTPQSGSHIHTE